MNFCVYFFIISTISLLTSSLSGNLVTNSSLNLQKLPKIICKIANDITNSKPDTQDVIIGNLGGKICSSTFNMITKCIDDDSAVLISNFNKLITKQSLRKAEVVILTFDRISEISLTNLVHIHRSSSVWHHLAKIICIVPATTTQKNRASILLKFTQFGFLNVAVIHEALNGDILAEVVTSLAMKGGQMRNPKNGLSLFPDKLKDMKGYKYKIAVHSQPPLIIIGDKFVNAQMFHFFDAIKTIQNSKVDVLIVKNNKNLDYMWKNRQMDLTFNTALVVESQEPKLLTYEKRGYCALVPVPPKVSLSHLIFVRPFDGLIWIFFGVSVVSSVAVWRMYPGHGAVDSHWQLTVGIFMMFINQGADFSRHNRFVLAVLLNIICMSVFLLSNLYEGVITSFMIEPAHENRLKTVEDVVASDYEIMGTEAFKNHFKDSSLVKSLGSRLNTSNMLIGTDDGRNVMEQRYVFIRLCDVAENVLVHQVPNGRFISEYYYILPEQLTWQFVRLEASSLN